MSRGVKGRNFGSYIDINPNRTAPRWWSYPALAALAVVTALVVAAALSAS